MIEKIKEAMNAVTYKDSYSKDFVLFVQDFVLLSKKEFNKKYPNLKYQEVKKWLNSSEKNPYFEHRFEENPFTYLSEKIEDEGLGYFVTSYTNGLACSPTLKSFLMFQKANVFLEDYNNYIEMKSEKEN